MTTAKSRAPAQLTKTHRMLIGVVVFGAVVIAGIGFAGSYAAVRELAIKKGFGDFSYVFPIGIDAGICVLLALDLLLTWIRIPFPLLRQTAWLLTAATIAFNGAAAWPDPLGVGMHAVIPVLFVVAVEAARHAIGRIADITADKHMEGVRLTRWLLSPVPTFLLWRRMKLWELRSYDQVIKLEQERLVYQARLRSRFGRAWRRKAPVESLMPLRLARYGVPLADTAPMGLAAAGIKNQTPPPPTSPQPAPAEPVQRPLPLPPAEEESALTVTGMPSPAPTPQASTTQPTAALLPEDATQNGLFAEAYQAWLVQFQRAPTAHQFGQFLRDQYAVTTAAGGPLSDRQLAPIVAGLQQRYAPPPPAPADKGESTTDADAAAEGSWEEFFYSAWLDYAKEHGAYPDADAFAAFVFARDRITTHNGTPLAGEDLADFVTAFWQRDLEENPPATADAAPGETERPSPQPAIPAQAEAEGAGNANAVPAAQAARGPEAHASLETPGQTAEEHPEDDHQGGEGEPESPEPGEGGELTTVDRYYLAWAAYQEQHGHEPKAPQLSEFLAGQGILGRGGQGVSPSTLRRYMPAFRLFAVWAELRVHTAQPDAQDVVRECVQRGIALRRTALTPELVEAESRDFERRWQALTRQTGLIERAD